MNAKSKRLSNHFTSCRLVSLTKLKDAATFPGRDANGPYTILQEAYDPEDTAMRSHEFILGRSGAWLAMHWFVRMPIPERREEFIFGTKTEVMAFMESLIGPVKVIREKPSEVDEDGPADDELEKVLSSPQD